MSKKQDVKFNLTKVMKSSPLLEPYIALNLTKLLLWHSKFSKKCQINIDNMFPNEILVEIFSNLDLKDLGRCTMVSKRFSELSRHSMFILLKNVTGLEDISRAMSVLYAESTLMECVWKFYEIHKEWQKEKQICEKLISSSNSTHIGKYGLSLPPPRRGNYGKVSFFLQKRQFRNQLYLGRYKEILESFLFCVYLGSFTLP